MPRFDHIVSIDEAARELVIHRIDSKGKCSLYTKAPLPRATGWSPDLEAFARQLGENLLMDSPLARRILGL